MNVEEYISGEQHHQMVVGHKSKSSVPKILGLVAVVIVFLGLSFYGGVLYQKSHQPKTAAAITGGANQGAFIGRSGGAFGGQRRVSGTAGQVTAASAGSITVQNASSGNSSTFSIVSSTQITDSGQTVTASDIKTGDMVFVVADATNTSQAARIIVNPGFGGAATSSSSGPVTTN